jgi:hypothetical protein
LALSSAGADDLAIALAVIAFVVLATALSLAVDANVAASTPN